MINDSEQKAIENIEKELNKKYEVVPLYKDFSINSPMNIIQKHYNDTDIKIILNLISKLQADIEIKDKVINYMAKEINKAYYDKNHFYLFFEGNFDDKNLPKRINKIKQHFYKKAEEEKC